MSAEHDDLVHTMSSADATVLAETLREGSGTGVATPALVAPTLATDPLSGKWKKGNEAEADHWFDRLRHSLHCSLFCGGASCKHEDWLQSRANRNVHPAIEGLNSNWVGDNVIASQRPSSSLFLKHMLVSQFKAKQITGVFNLQEKGEHASCGPDGIYAASGYSYIGESDLMRHGVHYYEFPWPDMTAPEHDVVLRSVQVMDSHVHNSGRVLVHCHAGLGRTGLMIACYLVYSTRRTADDAIQLVRLSRPGSLQTDAQVEFVHGFERRLWNLQTAFRLGPGQPPIDVDAFLSRQRQYLHGETGERYRFVPRPILVLLCHCVALAQRDVASAQGALDATLSSFRLPDAKDGDDGVARMCVLVNLGQLEASCFHSASASMLLVMHWLRSLSEPVVTFEMAASIVAYMRKSDDTRNPLMDAIAEIFSRVKRHTIGLVLSAVFFLLTQTSANDTKRHATYRNVTTSLIQCHEASRIYLTNLEMDVLSSFFEDWANSIRFAYFDPTVVPPQHKVVGKIAQAAAEVLDRVSGQYVLERQKAAAHNSADVVVTEVT